VTRLRAEDLAGLGRNLDAYDRELKAKTGRSLRQIGCRAAGIDEEGIPDAGFGLKVGVIPVTAGKGMIPGFVQAVKEIIGHLGFQVFVPARPDVAGLAEAVEGGAGMVFLADDAIFVAINLSTRRVVENSEATGRGYGAALEGLAGGKIRGSPVLVVGAGRVGSGAAKILSEMGGEIGIFDPEPGRAEGLAGEVGGRVEDDLDQALERYTLVVDACPAAGIIDVRHIKPATFVAAPGIPLGLTSGARTRIGDRLIHDPLQIGVATMMITSLASAGDL